MVAVVTKSSRCGDSSGIVCIELSTKIDIVCCVISFFVLCAFFLL